LEQIAAPPGAHNSLITNMLNLLPRRCWRRLRTDLSLVEIVIEEVLRLESPLQRFYRVMTSEVELSGVAHSAGDLVIICSGMGIRQNLLIPTSSGRAAGLRNDVGVWYGHPLLFGRAALARVEAAVSPNASWTVFRDQTSSELIKAAFLISLSRSL
jgi:hypothetical protein